jgi:hypothetical protein
MKLIGYGLIITAAWLYIEAPWTLVVVACLAAGAVGYHLRGASLGSSTSEADEAPSDPVHERLVGMGFRAEEVRPLLAKARARGETDPAGYVMRSLIR